MEGSALRNLRVFRDLCGPEPLKNVILATTFWDHVHPTVGQAREAELSTRSEFWGAMVKRGSRIARFDGLASGLGIISGLLDLEPQPLKIQRELVDDEISLVNTSAGQVVNEELEKFEHEHRIEKQKVQQELAEALERRDIELQEILQAEHERVEAELSKVQRQQAQLKADRRAEHRRMQNEFERQMWEMEDQNCTLERRLTKHNEDRQREKEEDHQRISRLEYELAKYNDAATRRWDGLEIDQIIAQIRVEESKLRAEDREKLEAEIQKLRLLATTDAQAFRPPPQAGLSQAKPSRWNGAAKKAGAIFVAGLKIALPITTLFTIGMPIGLSSSGSGLSTLTDIFSGGGDAGAA